MSERIAVVANEAKLSNKVAGELRQALADHGVDDIAWCGVKKAAAATKAVTAAVKDGADRVIVSGGDGTVRAAIEALAGTDIPLAVLPTGTANLFATALQLPTNASDVAAAAVKADTRVIDVGYCNDLAFAVMAGTGFDAMMIEQADASKERLGMIAYVRAGVKATRERTPFRVRVKVDGAMFFEGDATCVLLGNLGTLKGGVQAFPDAQPDDGKLDVAVVTASGLREWGQVMWSAVRRRQEVSGHTHLTQGERISVKLDRPQAFELDGGSKGKDKRLDFSVLPAALTVCRAV